MKNIDISQYINLSHTEILEKFPEISLIKEYSALIIEFYLDKISEDYFRDSLKKHGITAATIETLVLSLKQKRQIKIEQKQ